jgi:hypothetical protein
MRVDSRIFILKWWITCFTSVLSPLDASRLWDMFLVGGISCLLAFSMALLEQLFKAHAVSPCLLCSSLLCSCLSRRSRIRSERRA